MKKRKKIFLNLIYLIKSEEEEEKKSKCERETEVTRGVV